MAFTLNLKNSVKILLPVFLLCRLGEFLLQYEKNKRTSPIPSLRAEAFLQRPDDYFEAFYYLTKKTSHAHPAPTSDEKEPYLDGTIPLKAF